MRSPARLALPFATLASVILAAMPSFAQDPPPANPPPAAQPPAADPVPAVPPDGQPLPPAAPSAAAPIAVAPAPAAADRPSETAAPPAGPRRSEGIRLGVDLSFQRAFSGDKDRLNAGSPSLVPVGLDVSFHTSPKVVWGVHGYYGFASRDDCVSADSCRARGLGFGGHIETTLGSGRSFIPWLRYGMGYELLYQGGAPFDAAGHVFRGAFDILDLRIGGDIIVSRDAEGKTTAIAPFIGLVGGFLVSQSGYSSLNGSGGQKQDLDRNSGSGHLWFTLGVRGTLDP